VRVCVVLLVTLAAAVALPAVAHARPAPVTWCGTDETSADRVPDLTVGKPIRFVYAVPSDGGDHFLDTASGIATDAAAIDAWWRAQDPSRTPRFDRYPFPGCTSEWGKLDIGFVRLPRTSGGYLAADDTYTALQQDLATSFPDDQKTILYYDGPTNDPICGRSPVAEFWGGRYGISIVYLQTDPDCFMQPVGSGTSAEVAAHELLHSLGATPDAAPHACASYHVCDSGTDILTQYIGLASTLDVVALDYQRDDYYGHAGAWWDAQDSLWLSHLPEHTLTVSVVGQGAPVLLVGDLPVDCDTGCTTVVEDGEEVSIAATPDAGWQLGGWSGSCSGTDDTCTLDGTTDAAVTLTYVHASVRTVVRVVGKGRVVSSPAGLSCTAVCHRTFADAEAVTLRAVPAAGWSFAGWHGDCAGKTCAVGDGSSVTATFAQKKRKKR
jgi:hypothetical protein